MSVPNLCTNGLYRRFMSLRFMSLASGPRQTSNHVADARKITRISSVWGYPGGGIQGRAKWVVLQRARMRKPGVLDGARASGESSNAGKERDASRPCGGKGRHWGVDLFATRVALPENLYLMARDSSSRIGHERWYAYVSNALAWSAPPRVGRSVARLRGRISQLRSRRILASVQVRL
jgi:hypothetical protein